jgi:hypothetical protein
MKRNRSLYTDGVYDTTRWGPLLLMRVMSPIDDPYERDYNPHVSLRPYINGEHCYTAILRLGRWSFEVRYVGNP